MARRRHDQARVPRRRRRTAPRLHRRRRLRAGDGDRGRAGHQDPPDRIERARRPGRVRDAPARAVHDRSLQLPDLRRRRRVTR